MNVAHIYSTAVKKALQSFHYHADI